MCSTFDETHRYAIVVLFKPWTRDNEIFFLKIIQFTLPRIVLIIVKEAQVIALQQKILKDNRAR